MRRFCLVIGLKDSVFRNDHRYYPELVRSPHALKRYEFFSDSIFLKELKVKRVL